MPLRSRRWHLRAQEAPIRSRERLLPLPAPPSHPPDPSSDTLADGASRRALKKSFSDGTVAVDLDPLSLLSRLAASVPSPRRHTVRYDPWTGPEEGRGGAGVGQRVPPRAQERGPRSPRASRGALGEEAASWAGRVEGAKGGGGHDADREPRRGESRSRFSEFYLKPVNPAAALDLGFGLHFLVPFWMR